MKLNLKTAAIVLLAAFMTVSFLSCVDQSVLPLGTGADLLGLRIGNVTVAAIPGSVPDTAWDNEELDLYNMGFESALFNKESDIKGARIRPSISRDATAEWGIGARTVRPGDFYDTRVPADFESDEFIYIRVTSGDKRTIKYYRYYTRVFSWVTDLAGITIAEREAKAGIGGSSPSLASLGFIYITTSEAANTLVETTTFDPNATVRFARLPVTALADEEPNFRSATERLTFSDQDILHVEVTAQNTIDKAFFRFRVHVGRMTSIASLKFKNGPKEVELYGKGLPNGTWNNVGPGSYATAKSDQPAGGFDILIQLDDPDGTASYQIYSALPSTQPSSLNNTKAEFDNGDYLVIMVRSLNGNARSYYQIKVTLLAANIKTQPKSAWYRVGEPAAALTVELYESGSYTYQWYEADSLFGIYGRHGVSIDEKNNISTINGGPDMYYYLSQPGINQYGGAATTTPSATPWRDLTALAWAIPGETGTTYTPRTDWVDVPMKLPLNSSQNSSYPYDPATGDYTTGATEAATPPGGWPTPAPNHVNFLTGSTSEVRYYWVVVTNTATNLTVTSDRAVILTETDPNMDHFIFELSELPYRKNLAPFTSKDDVFEIDIPADYFERLKPGFNPGDYQICIAQAQYFLPDGRPWTQNWTHGDLHFGYTEGSPSYTLNSGSPLTWWQNNLGANSGSIPLQAPHSSQGGLSFPPDWVGFKPSGDKARGFPPLDSATGQLPVGYKPTGYPAGIAQGYFCGFIELLELRFATAPTN